MFKKAICLLSILLVSSLCYNMSEEEIDQTIKEKTITCGSSLRIQNEITKYYLSSFSMNWSSGSRLQIITAVKDNSQYESLFVIKEADGQEPCVTGTPIKCDSIIRLEHVTTEKNLHSHEYPSFITSSQEACAFGSNGNGDVNDNFKIICYKWKEENIKGETQFFLQHVATGKYLYINYKNSMYNDYNCRGCPINGQREVSLTATKDKQCLWKVAGGIIYSEPEEDEKGKSNKKEDDDNTEEEDNSEIKSKKDL